MVVSRDQNNDQIKKKPRNFFLKGGQSNEFKKAVDEKKTCFLMNELKKLEEIERRGREEIAAIAGILISFKEASPFMVCDQKNTNPKRPTSVCNSHPHPQQKRKRRRNPSAQSTLPPPEMPGKIRDAISMLQGTPPVWLTEKTLTDSDVKEGQGRFFIPTCTSLNEFMTVEEKIAAWVEKEKKQIKIKKSDEKQKKTKMEVGLNVILVNPMGDWQEVSFRIWSSLEKCVFTKTWKSLCKRFNLLPSQLKPSNLKHTKDKVQLWCFRLPVDRGSKLCFAMNIVKNIEPAAAADNA